MPKSGANPKRSQRNDERRQWAATVVKKATPKIVKSLVEAAESLDAPADPSQPKSGFHPNEAKSASLGAPGLLGTPAPMSQSKPAGHALEERQDESLAALLLRFLRTGENSEKKNVAANATTTVSDHPSVG